MHRFFSLLYFVRYGMGMPLELCFPFFLRASTIIYLFFPTFTDVLSTPRDKHFSQEILLA